MLRSLKSRLILASLLWTSGLLMLFHMASIMLVHMSPSLRHFNGFWAVSVALILLAAGLAAARASLSLFKPLREKLSAVHQGEALRVAGAYPTEIQPLIDDLNALLTAREKAVARASTTAADLAHGLKTPLALLAAESNRIAAAGNAELAESIAHQVERMSRQIDYHLARARATAFGATGAVPCPLVDCTDALIRTVSKLYADRALTISSSIQTDFYVRVQREDLEEILGNLLDNACKWAKSKVVVKASRTSAFVVVTVDDDGAGIDPSLRDAVLKRGVRIDEASPGSGLGLAIVRDLAELYGGSISLDASALGGLRATVSLPAVAT